MATLKEAIQIAKQEPNSERSQRLQAAIVAGKMDGVAAQEGIDLSSFKQKMQAGLKENNPSIVASLAGAAGSFAGKALANPGESLSNLGGTMMNVAKGNAAVLSKVIGPKTPEVGTETPETLETRERPVDPRFALAEGLYKSTVKPIAKGAIGASYGGIASSVSAAKAQMEGKTPEEIEEARRAPIEVPGFGDVNPARPSNAAGMAMETAGGAINTAALMGSGLATKVGSQAASGFLSGTGEALQEDKDIGEALVSGVVGGAVQGATSWLAPKVIDSTKWLGSRAGKGLQKLFGAESQAVIKEATKQEKGLALALAERIGRKAGLKEVDINVVRNMTPAQRAKIADPYLEAALAKADDYVGSPSVLQLPANEIQGTYKALESQRKVVGKNIENAIAADLKGKSLNGADAVKGFGEALDNLNIKVTNKGLDFSTSDIATNTEAQTGLKTIYDNIRKGRTITPNLYETVEGINLNGRDLVSILRNTNAVSDDPLLAAALRPFKEAIDKTLSVSKLYSTANSEYSQIMNIKNALDNVGGYLDANGRVSFNGVKFVQAGSGGLQTPRNAKFQEAIKTLQGAKNLGIEVPEDLGTKAYFANLAEKITGTTAQRGTENVMGLAGNIPGKIGAAARMIESGKEVINDIAIKAGLNRTVVKDAFTQASESQVQAVRALLEAPYIQKLGQSTVESLVKVAVPRISKTILPQIVRAYLQDNTQDSMQNNQDDTEL